MKGFRDRLGGIIATSDGYKDNVWKLSTDAGLGRKTVYNILNDTKLDVSTTGPGLFGMARVARLLGTSLDHLAGNAPPITSGSHSSSLLEHAAHTILTQSSPEKPEELSSDQLLRLHAKSGGRIEAFTHFLSRCDQYFTPEPTDTYTRVMQVGENSLSAITMGSADINTLQDALIHMEDKSLQARVLSDYRQATQRGTLATLETLDIPMPNKPVKVKMDFVRTLLSVSDAKGNNTILNFSFLVV